MKPNFLKKCVLVFSASILFFYGIIYACGPDWGWEYDGNSSFTPETFVDKSYSPLFYSNYEFFYGIGFDTEHISRFNDEILSDWSDFLKGSCSPKIVRFFLLETNQKLITELRNYYQTKKKTPLVVVWDKKLKLNDLKVKSFIQFMYYAQILEQKSKSDSFDWSYQNKEAFLDTAWFNAIEKKYETATDAFMKNRYWFQLMKGYYYNENLEKANSFFEKTKAVTPKNTLYYRALAYIAGLEYQQKRYAKANYLYSQVFDHCPKMRVVAANCFHPQEQTDWEQSLRLAKTNDEKAALWAIQGFYGDEYLALDKIYSLNPKNEHLHFLLTRLINLEEQKIQFDFSKNTIAETRNGIKESLDTKLYTKVIHIAQNENTSKPYLWHLAAGYLQTLQGKFDAAKQSYDASEKQMPATLLAQSQLRVLRFMNQWLALDAISAADEVSLLANLKWLYFDCGKKTPESFRLSGAITLSKTFLAALYAKQGDFIKSELFVSQPDFYSKTSNLLAMKSFLSKPIANKTAFEQLASQIYTYTLSDINDFQAVEAAFQNKIPEAIQFMEQSDTKNSLLYGDPFIGGIQDCHDCDHFAPQKTKYSRLQFLNSIKDMQSKLNNKQNVYENALTLGHAFYNMTYYGNARVFYEGKINGYGTDTYSRLDCSNAVLYYKKALAAAVTAEQKAECHYMLAKCQRNSFYTQQYQNDKSKWSWGFEGENINFLEWNGFKELKNNYSKTDFYQEVVQECGYFKTYLAQGK